MARAAPSLESATRKIRAAGNEFDRRRRGIPERVTYPWYDSTWLSSYVQARAYLTKRRPDKLEEFERALSVFRTDPDFQPAQLDTIFDDRVLDRIRETVAAYSIEQLEVHELASFGRFVVHDDPYFLELQRDVVDLVSDLVAERVETSYNFLSLYQGAASCPVHMDAPSAKWTLDICVDQSRSWPILISDVIEWPDSWQAPQNGKWADSLRGSTTFTSHVMDPGQALVFGGSSQWHYRDPMPQATPRRLLHAAVLPLRPRRIGRTVAAAELGGHLRDTRTPAVLPMRSVGSADPAIVAARRRHSAELLILGLVAAPVLPVLHLCNRLSTRRTIARVAWLASLSWPHVRLHPTEVGRVVNVMARVLHLHDGTCLARSQLIWLLLSIGDFDPVIQVGAAAGLGTGTMAHAWVELDGIPVADPTDVATLHPPFDRPLLGASG